jgi:hypothetical protein
VRAGWRNDEVPDTRSVEVVDQPTPSWSTALVRR